jgi:hypothetical protein
LHRRCALLRLSSRPSLLSKSLLPDDLGEVVVVVCVVVVVVVVVNVFVVA